MMDMIIKIGWRILAKWLYLAILIFLCCSTSMTAQPAQYLASVHIETTVSVSPPVERKKKKTRRAKKRKKRKGKQQSIINYADWDRSYMLGIGFLGLLFTVPVVTMGVLLILNYVLITNVWGLITSMAFIVSLATVLFLLGAVALYFLIRAFVKMGQIFPSKDKFDWMLWVGILSSVLAIAILVIVPVLLFSAVTANIFAILLFTALGALGLALIGIHFSQLGMKNRSES